MKKVKIKVLTTTYDNKYKNEGLSSIPIKVFDDSFKIGLIDVSCVESQFFGAYYGDGCYKYQMKSREVLYSDEDWFE